MSKVVFLGDTFHEADLKHRSLNAFIELGETNILLNCAYGVLQKLLHIGVHHTDINHIILPHFHPAHIADLLPFLHAGAQARDHPRTTDLHIYGPPGTRDALFTFIDLFDLRKSPLAYTIITHDSAEKPFQIGAYYFEFTHFLDDECYGLKLTKHKRLVAIINYPLSENVETPEIKDVELAIIAPDNCAEQAITHFATYSHIKNIILLPDHKNDEVVYLQNSKQIGMSDSNFLFAYDLMSFAF